MRKIAILFFLALGLSLGGCLGGDSEVKVQQSRTVSKGKELTDLQRALQEGAINQSEYDKLREIILKRPS